MDGSRIVVPFMFAAFFVVTTEALAADVAPSPPPNNAKAEQILKHAHDALAKIDRLDVDCRWSDLDDHRQTEVCYQAHFYLQNPAGYLFQIRPLPVAGKVSRGRTKSGIPFRLKSRPAETTLFVNGVSTEIDDVGRTYFIEKCEPQPGNPIANVEQSRYFSSFFIPHPLHWASGWDTVRKDYRIEELASTPTTIGIALIPRSHESWDEVVKKGFVVRGDSPPDSMLSSPDFWKELMGDQLVAPNREEIVLDRQTLLPKSWKRIYGWSDSLITYERFDVNPAPRPLAVSLSGYRQGLPPNCQWNFNVANSNPNAKAAGDTIFFIMDDDELDAEMLLLETGYCFVRLVGLF
jgi:hypothetical protein